MTDDPYKIEAAQRWQAAGWHAVFPDHQMSEILAQTLRKFGWRPPADPRVEAVADYLGEHFLPEGTNVFSLEDQKRHAAEIIKLVEGVA